MSLLIIVINWLKTNYDSYSLASLMDSFLIWFFMVNAINNAKHSKQKTVICHTRAAVILILLLLPLTQTEGMPPYHYRACLRRPACRLRVLPQKPIRIGGNKLNVYIAGSKAAKRLGLSGVRKLADNQGMIFVFKKPQMPGFWMINMRFALDIIWIDADESIISILHNVSPKTYPKRFYPSKPVRYVVETKAGYAKEHNISAGDKINAGLSDE